MKCNETEKNKACHQKNLDDLDVALQDLGMLSAITEARDEYLRETKSNYGVMRLNTRFVSNVTVGYCMKRATNKNRLCPYVLPVRHRTKSENSDAANCDNTECSREFMSNLLEPSTSRCNGDQVGDSNANNTPRCSTKRCQSLENLNLSIESQPALEVSPEMECVSTRIQKLHVDE